jgi:hypothetical protein
MSAISRKAQAAIVGAALITGGLALAPAASAADVIGEFDGTITVGTPDQIDKAVAKVVTQDAATIKIPSNSHSDAAEAMGVTFEWNVKQKDNGAVIVADLGGGAHAEFDLLVQSSGKYFSVHVDQTGVWEIPEPTKNINMVYIYNYGAGQVKAAEFLRYRTYVSLWGDYELNTPGAIYHDLLRGNTPGSSAADLHYAALLANQGESCLPTYFHFDNGDKALFEYWADQLENDLVATWNADKLNGDLTALSSGLRSSDISLPLTAAIPGYAIQGQPTAPCA